MEGHDNDKKGIKIPPALPPRGVSRGMQLQQSNYSSDVESESLAIQGKDSKEDVAAKPPVRPPRPANFTIPSNLTKEREDVLLSQLACASAIVYLKPERATKFTFNTDRGKWEMQTTRVRLAKDSFSEGGMRLAYRALEVNNDQPFVIKLFKDNKTKPAIVFHEALTQAVSEKYAVAFNNLCERQNIVLRLKFLPVFVLHLTQRSQVVGGKHLDLYATMEPYLPGKYVKLSDNSGRHLNDIPAQAAQTFSHYSLLASGHKLVVVDIQGVSELVATADNDTSFTAKTLTLTDPQIHSVDGAMFGAGNLGVPGINAFITSYKRTMFDEQLKLAHLTNAHLLPEVKSSSSSAPLLKQEAGAPPFDTAELASILAADERAAAEEEDQVSSLQPNMADKSPAKRTSDFSVGGELFRLSMYARDMTGSITEV